MSGVAFTTIVYSTDAIGDIGRVSATTFGANGDTVTALINEDVGDATLFFVPGQLTLTANATYWDFTLPVTTDFARITITAILIDFYGNAVTDAPIAFVGTGVSDWLEVGYEAYTDEGVDGFGAADGCFTWRDYGSDNDPETPDWGTFNDDHDAFDLDGDGIGDNSDSDDDGDGYDDTEDLFPIDSTEHSDNDLDGSPPAIHWIYSWYARQHKKDAQTHERRIQSPVPKDRRDPGPCWKNIR